MATYSIGTHSRFTNLALNAKSLNVDSIKNVKIITIEFLDEKSNLIIKQRKDINYLEFLTKNEIAQLEEEKATETSGSESSGTETSGSEINN